MARPASGLVMITTAGKQNARRMGFTGTFWKIAKMASGSGVKIETALWEHGQIGKALKPSLDAQRY